MKSFALAWVCIGTSLAMWYVPPLPAAPVRFALLADSAALANTTRLLRSAGCDYEAVASFESLASNRTSRPNVDLSPVHRDRDGFYHFSSVSNLLDTVEGRGLCGGTNFDFNCFDTALLLACPRLRTSLKPDDLIGTLMVYRCATNYGPTKSWIVPAATPRDAFMLHYGSDNLDYGRITTAKFPPNMRDARICLTAALFAVNILPGTALTNCSSDTVLSVLQSAWRRGGLLFPGDCELLLLHEAEGRMLRTSHAGLVFPRGREFTYIEKTCGPGHFVRLDVSDKADIFEWVVGAHTHTNTVGKVFLTLNENIAALCPAPQSNQAGTNKPSGD